MSTPGPNSRHWEINGLRLEGLCWGEPGSEPVLCLHGWLDNAASFSLLAPLLTGFHVVALDLSGHGQSARRSADAGYQIWDDLPEIMGVLDELGWDQFSLLGHSRGAIISSMLASTLPQRVRRLVLLDAISPPPVDEAEFPLQMAKFLQDKPRLLRRKTRVFATIEEAVASRVDNGLSEDSARLLAERNLRPCSGGYTWTTDPRLRGASAVKLTEGQIRAVWEALTMPTLLLMAERGAGAHPEVALTAQRHVPDLTLEKMPGGHHFHMEGCVTEVAQRVRRFLQV